MSSFEKALTVFMAAFDESGQAGDRSKVLARRGGIGIHLDVVPLSDRDAELEGVDRIEAETFAEQRSVAIDLLDAQVLEIEDFNEQLLEFLLQAIHPMKYPVTTLAGVAKLDVAPPRSAAPPRPGNHARVR